MTALGTIAYTIVFGNTCKTNIDINENLFSYNQEEADIGTVLHALDVTQRNSFSELVDSCFDTDVLLILLHYFEDICSSTTFKTRNKEIYLRTVYKTLGKEICKLLLGFHSFTGYNQTERFYGYSKLTCWKVFMSSNISVRNAFQCRGGSLAVDVYNEMEQYVLQLYDSERPSAISNLQELRRYMFSKHQYKSDKLSPTKMALGQKVLRAHYTALTWKSAHMSSPILPGLQEYGWTLNKITNLYHPIMTKSSPVPDTVVELSLSRCKTGCTQRRYICKKNDLLCTEMCLCVNCSNEKSDEEKIDSNSDVDENND